jgi:hypothetical protein
MSHQRHGADVRDGGRMRRYSFYLLYGGAKVQILTQTPHSADLFRFVFRTYFDEALARRERGRYYFLAEERRGQPRDS